jgi:hypothetical protein
LCKLATKAQYLINEDPGWENELALWCNEDLYISTGKEYQYGNFIYLLHHGTFLENLSPKERRAFRIKFAQYRLINSLLFYVNYDGVLLRCLECEDAEKIMREIHDGLVAGHFVGDTTAHKILRFSYY